MSKELVCILSLFVFFIIICICISEKRIRKLRSEIDNLCFECDKISFRLFVLEKKQKLVQERKTG